MGSENEKKSSHYHAFMTEADRWKRTSKDYSRANRCKATASENALWQLVRGNKLGPRFRRQHAIERYIVDFICLPAWLIIEVDGEYHLDNEQAEYDGGRTHNLQKLGFHILRFTNEEVLNFPDHVLKIITSHLTKHLPNPQSLGSPSPRGEGAGG
ncbi:endonuclease domain-containing protein [Hymenobacter properus]|uniref:Endonuclease domain-containing protein n=1 Tax=Hymenobacter properus TaxID=2791026 RepID=A0A931BBG4_9BACT|nr:endonuclease domain-containing protein [Hymenobacter properus]MBF9140224.1 endonuclease domain-containing protein [Hymenobacter properus]MBR7719031.1 endonuclease domain-containing protein [Microvirga sp. SRT04]